MFEDSFETYDSTGGAQLLTPQSDYTSDAPQVVHVISLNPIDSQSLRHVGDSSDAFEFDLFSSVFPATYGQFEFEVRITGESTYQIATSDTDSGYFNARIEFSEGSITVYHGTLPRLEMTSTLTDATFIEGEDFRIVIEVTRLGELLVFKDDVLIFEGLENNFAQFGIPGRIGQWAVWASSENDGFVDGAGDTLTIDNVEMIAAPCQEDLSGNGVVNALDLATLLSDWGVCIERLAPCPSDLDHNGIVGASDIANLLSAWGACQ